MIHKFPWRSTLTVAFLIGISAPAAAAPEMKLRPGAPSPWAHRQVKGSAIKMKDSIR